MDEINSFRNEKYVLVFGTIKWIKVKA